MPYGLKKHWTSLLGALFVICSIIYLFKFTLDQGWITDPMKTGAGLLAGAGIGFAGFTLITKRRLLTGEIVSGLGASVLYTTFAFSGVYYALWNSMTVFLAMLALTAGLTLLSYRFGLRLLMGLSLAGAFAAPLVMRPEDDQVFTLFLYLLVLNSAYFILSIKKGWMEYRLMAFVGTWFTYLVYFIHFDPAKDTLWSLPFRYALAAYLFYVVGFWISSFRMNRTFDGLNLYLGFVNAVLFGMWCTVLLAGEIRLAYPLGAMGLLYLLLAWASYRSAGKNAAAAVSVQTAGGALLLLTALSQIGSGHAAQTLVNVLIWGLLAALLMALAVRLRMEWLQAVSVAVWFGVTLSWFFTTWDAPRGEWFGVYLPFLNWGAVAWMILAATGFWYSLGIRFSAFGRKGTEGWSRIFSVISHLIVGGLLTVQIENIYEEYRLDGWMDRGLTMSVVWGIYALLLFLWGASTRQRLFRLFGSVVLVLVSVKVLFYDLSGEDTVYKVLVLLAMAAISFAISYINHRWQEPEREREPEEEVFPVVPARSEQQEEGEAAGRAIIIE